MAKITTKETRSFSWSDFDRSALKVGDEIAETLKDGREVTFVVMDDGVMGLKDCLGYHRMNDTWTNKGGWLKTEMRRYLNEEVIDLLPDDLRSIIKPRAFGSESDMLWLFSEPEIFGEHIWGAGDEGDKQLRYFAKPGNRVKLDEDCEPLVGAFATWQQLHYFCSVYSNGNAVSSYASYSWGVCFGFYF